MKIAVTGGAGFIGSHLVDRLVEAGHEAVVLDLRPPHRPDAAHRPADVRDVDALTRALRGCDAVYHLAAVSDVNVAAADPVGTVDVNVTGTARVWEAARRAGVERAVLASTVWVYAGADGEAPLDEDAPFHLPAAGHIYTSSKIAAELVVHSCAQLYGQPFTILRYGIPFGPRMRDALVIPRFVTTALAGKALRVDGDGSQYRNYVYIADLVDANVTALGPVGENQVFNLEGPEPVTIRRVVEAIVAGLDQRLPVEFGPPRPGDYPGRDVSAAKARRLLGWEPQVSFEEGVRRYLDWRLGVPGAADGLAGA